MGCRSPAEAGAGAGAEPTHRAWRGSLWHEPRLATALGVQGSRNGSVSSFLVEPRGFFWDPGSFCTASSAAGLCRSAGERLMYSWIYLMNQLCSFCCFLICIGSSCQPNEGE